MRSHTFVVAVVVLEKQALVLVATLLSLFLVELSQRTVVADLVQVSTCLQLRLLLLQTLAVVLHIKLHFQAVFTLHQLEAHKMAHTLSQAVQ
jgi:hypothetical protein